MLSAGKGSKDLTSPVSKSCVREGLWLFAIFHQQTEPAGGRGVGSFISSSLLQGDKTSQRVGAILKLFKQKHTLLLCKFLVLKTKDSDGSYFLISLLS